MTSVGAGTVVIVLLMLAYRDLPMRLIVGTDLMQAIPLVASAAVSHAFFGDLQFALTTALTLGGIVGVVLGALLSSRAPNHLIRPALAFLLLASALKLLDVPTRTVGAVLLAVAAVGLAAWLATSRTRPWRRDAGTPGGVPVRSAVHRTPEPQADDAADGTDERLAAPPRTPAAGTPHRGA
jgi:hypothetical protein